MQVVQTAQERPATYETLYGAHHARVTRLCRALLADADEGADVTQEVFVKLHQAFAVEERSMGWGAWLTRVAVNACRDRRRSGWWRWWRERGLSIDETTLPAWVRTPEDETLGRETQRRIWDAFAALPQRQREVFALRMLEGHSTAETAETLDVDAGTVKRHLFRAIHTLRRRLGDES